ncbi:ral guanine nucleotide dissociation stimulator [Platysternon megacephalum]|uniref:Ral guanine nucleotide dissociation stimulator n=1 Tax=Platysternon megacephalum TaxID=55544 RepID=A0A4D9E1D9_9SAUR|nr:ral guanine nucleotide dissociation stimulator [Platysternon megacephalum]
MRKKGWGGLGSTVEPEPASVRVLLCTLVLLPSSDSKAREVSTELKLSPGLLSQAHSLPMPSPFHTLPSFKTADMQACAECQGLAWCLSMPSVPALFTPALQHNSFALPAAH